ncbi:MAG: hypothetical protein V4654_00300 [Bdellovibrionota bacterium]
MKHGLFVTALLFTLVGFSFVGCADNQNNSHALYSAANFKISRRFNLVTPASTPTLQVFNQANQPVANAQVLIGTAIGNPFKDNLKITDKNGFVSLADWAQATHITVNAQGYIRQTLLNQKPGAFQIKLNIAYMTTRPVIKGQVTGLPVKDGDKMMDFSLVIPTISKGDLMSFDLDSIVSPFDDTIDIIFGKTADLPSNVSLPTQKEKYNFLISLTLSKPEHRVYTNNYGQKTFYAFSGKFPFKEVMEQLNADKQFYEVMNSFHFTNGSIREVTVAGPSTALNIPSGEIKFDGTQAGVKGATILADEVVMLLSLNDLSGGRFVPSDVKRLESKQTAALKTIAGKPTYIVSLLKKAIDFDSATQDVANRSSASMIAYKAGMQSSLLPLLPAGPRVAHVGGAYQITMPQSSNMTSDAQAVNELAVSVAISNINMVQNGQLQVEILDRKWEVLGTGWPKEITLPVWPLEDSEDATAVKRKFEVNLIGSESAKQTDLGDDLIKAATHVTKGAAEL